MVIWSQSNQKHTVSPFGELHSKSGSSRVLSGTIHISPVHRMAFKSVFDSSFATIAIISSVTGFGSSCILPIGEPELTAGEILANCRSEVDQFVLLYNAYFIALCSDASLSAKPNKDWLPLRSHAH